MDSKYDLEQEEGAESAKLISLFKVNGTCRVYLLKRFRDAQLISVLNF